MELIKKDYFDDNDGEFIGTRFFVDGNEITEEEYCDLVEDEENIVDILVEEYTDAILETQGCSDCIKNILYEFFDTIFDILENGYDEECEYCNSSCDYED